MKKVFLVIFLFTLSVSASAQLYVSFGKKYGWIHPDNLNRTVYTYNYTRQWLDQKMNYFKDLKGWEATIQGQDERVGLEVIASHLGQINIAHGIEPSGGLTGYRKIKLGIGGLSFGLTAVVVQKKHLEIAPAIDFDMHYFRVITTYSNDETFAGATGLLVVQKFKFANTFALNCNLFATKWLGIDVRPYIQLPYGKINIEGLMNELQGDENTQRERMMNYGISASIVLALGRDD
ncbi:hypothetical protein BH09BAC5_BH09BAC5_04150 [soil metagenome]